MENPPFVQQLKALSLCGLGLLLAIVLGWNIGSQNYWPLLLGGLIFVVASIALFSGRYFWLLAVASSFLGGTFPILGGQFTPFQILMAIGVVKFLIGDVVLRRTRIKVGNRFDLFMIAGFMGILTWHGIHDRFGMRFLGSTVWGGRNYVNVFVGLAAFFVVQSIPINAKIWAKLPYVVFAITVFDLLIAITTTIFPASIYIIFPFYSAVSGAGIAELVTGGSVETARLGAFGSFGGVLIILALASASVQQILKPPILLRAIALFVGFAAVLFSSFRSSVISTLAVILVAAIRDLKWGVFVFLPILVALLIAFTIVNSEIVSLPKQMQRSLAFLPGKWDAEMAGDAAASNDYRVRVWTLWARQYFPAQRLLGRGFGFKSEWTKPSTYKPTAIDYRQEVEVGNVHNGFLSSLDAWGIIGTVFFIAWNLRLLARTFQVTTITTDRYGVSLRFLALFLGASILCYWIGAPGVGSFLPQEFAIAGVFLRLQDAMTSDTIRRDPAHARVMEHVVREELAST